jgi:predicted Zn-dependent peptidase
MKSGSAGATAFAMATAVAAMWSCARPGQQLVFTYGEVRGQLPKNGLRFVVMPDPTTQLVEVDVRYEVGSREDPPGKAGLAHLVEHLMFEQQPGGPGTPTVWQILRQPTLNVNAYTDWDTTHFMINARADLLDTLVKIEATRMHDGCRTISQYEFLREREVVRNETRGRNRSAEALIPQLTLSAVYPPSHAYARMIGGNDEQLSAITLGDVCQFMQQYYVPERAVVVVAGGIAADRAIRSIENPVAVHRRTTPAHIAVISDDDPQVDVGLLYPSPPGIAGEQAARLVLTQMLDDQMWRIRTELGATYGVRVRRDARVSASAYRIESAVDAPRAGEAIRAMRAGIEALRSGSDFDAMFARARRKVAQELLNGSTVSIELARRLGETARFGLGPSFDNELLRDTAALSPEQVKQLIARELDPRSEVIVLLGDRAAVPRAYAEAGIDDARLVVPDAR